MNLLYIIPYNVVITSFGELAIKQTNDHFNVISKQNQINIQWNCFILFFSMINISMGINIERKFKSLLFMCADLV